MQDEAYHIHCGGFEMTFEPRDPADAMYHVLKGTSVAPVVQSYTDDILNSTISMAFVAADEVPSFIKNLQKFNIHMKDIVSGKAINYKSISIVKMLRITTSRKRNSKAFAKYTIEFEYKVL